MNSNITTINQIATFKLLILDDITSCDEIQNSNLSKELKSLFLSIKDGKEKILNLLPDGSYTTVKTISTPSKFIPTSYLNESIPSNEIPLVKTCIKIETEQMEFVKNMKINHGLPQVLKTYLEQILGVYQNTIQQLSRMIKTSQILDVVY